MAITLADLADTWCRVMDVTPSTLYDSGPFFAVLGGTPPTYRERLDAPRRNWRGDVIPSIALVQRNLHLLGPTRLDPARLR